MEPKGRQCKCMTCGRIFSGEGAFDRHRHGAFTPKNTRFCADPASLGMVEVEGVWYMQHSSVKADATPTQEETA